MLDALKDLLVHQYEAALCTLHLAVVRYPEGMWNQPVANLKFCQVGYVLFFGRPRS